MEPTAFLLLPPPAGLMIPGPPTAPSPAPAGPVAAPPPTTAQQGARTPRIPTAPMRPSVEHGADLLLGLGGRGRAGPRRTGTPRADLPTPRAPSSALERQRRPNSIGRMPPASARSPVPEAPARPTTGEGVNQENQPVGNDGSAGKSYPPL